MDDISLDSVALEQLHGEQKALLDAIDDLRKHGIGRFVDLPQIIVVGDQSSGKSSVLEAISRVRFPVKDGLCTRFATELVLRTDGQTKVDVRILPHSVPNKAIYKFDERSFKKADLPRIVEEAKKHMLEGDAGFSEDVLRIEITSPDVPHLTMVDLPGFYHSEDENQSAAGRIIVDRLVERYMARKNSIILAVISARNQVILQKVLSKVKHHDKHKERTIGIITKPDILTPGTQDEGNFIRMAKNLDRSHELSLGWHVLRNRGEMETLDTDEQRDEKETKFFEASLWASVPSKNRGVATLRKKLSGILLQHIKNNLQGLIESIEENIDSRKTQLERLGDPRSTTREMRIHLDKIASQFHILCLHAVEGNYVDEFFGGLYPGTDATAINEDRVRKLRALVRDLNRALAYVLETKGSRRIILPKSSNNGNTTRLFGGSTLKEESGRLVKKLTLPAFLLPLADQYKFRDPEKVTFEQITSDLETLSSANQGNEFPGTSNDRLAVKLFQDQSQPWEGIARCHLRLVLDMTKAFVEKLVGYLVYSDKRTCSAILTEVIDPFFEEKSVTLENKLQELLRHYKSGYPQPLDAEFRSLLAQKRQKNVGVDVIRDLIASRPEFFTEEAHTELMKAALPKTTTEFGVDSLIDKSETYYEMSLRTFIDNVVVLAVENCLIRDLPSILTTTKINMMEDNELERLASESPEVQTERKELWAEYEALKKGLQICKKSKERKTTFIPSILVEPEGPGKKPSAAGTSTAATDTSSNSSAPPSIPFNLPKPVGMFGGFSPPQPFKYGGSLFRDSNYYPQATSAASLGKSSTNIFGASPETAKPEPSTHSYNTPPLFKTTSFVSSQTPLNGAEQPDKYWSHLWPKHTPTIDTLVIPELGNNEHLNSMNHICFQTPYSEFSPEELRLISLSTYLIQ
ncbi:P-loop containing nucleoside triphosphate hydrolase protein [Daldinia grandis]|nr:P-loop containing nucleoside triphosphate hydrolase protein [Daldinia grandis]